MEAESVVITYADGDQVKVTLSFEENTTDKLVKVEFKKSDYPDFGFLQQGNVNLTLPEQFKKVK